MRKITLSILLTFIVSTISLHSQSILYSEPFNSNLSTCTATNGSFGNWIWTNNCAMSTAGGHTGPGSALFQGSGCQFGNGSNQVSGDLFTPTIALSAVGNTLTFRYYLSNECGTSQTTCFYDDLRFGISNNGGASYTDIMSSSGSPAGMTNTSGWTLVSYNLSTYIGQVIKIRFNFNSIDGIGNTYDGVYIDDVTVTGACSIAVVSTANNNTVSPSLCSGNSLTLTTNAVSNYFWSTGATTSSIVVSPTSNTSYSLTATSSSACVASAVINVSVVSGVPSLNVSASTNSACLGTSVTLAATGAVTYTWTGGVVNGVPFLPNSTSGYTVLGQNGCGTTSAVTVVTISPLVVSAVSSPTIACSTQAATLTAVSAVSGYTWQPGGYTGANVVVSPAVATVYTVTASNGTCQGVTTVNLPVNPIPTINVVASSTQVCQGAAVTLTASGGLSYVWTPGNLTGSVITVNPTGPTLYNVTGVNSFSCYTSNSQVVLTNSSPTLNVSVSDNLICAGGSSTITATGAITYSWSTGSNSTVEVVSPASTTVYTLTGYSANGCSTVQTINISVFQSSVTITGNTVICSGKSSTLTGSGADTYLWDNGSPVPAITVSPLVNTTYTLTTGTQTGNIVCADVKLVQVQVNPNPTLTVVPTRTYVCIKESNTLTASGASSYLWNPGGAGSSIVITSTVGTTINYTVVGTNSLSCSSQTVFLVKFNGCTSIGENSGSQNLFVVYPNPNNGTFILSGTSPIKLMVVNQLGQIVTTLSLNEGNNYKVQVSNLSAGVYLISGENQNEKLHQKIIVE